LQIKGVGFANSAPGGPVYAVGFVLCLVHSALDQLQARLAHRRDFHLIAKPHVTLDHLTRHADVVCNLIDVMPGRAAEQNTGSAETVNRRIVCFRRVNLPFSITLLLATGSSSHIDELRFLARSKGLVLDEKGLRRGSTIIASQNEEEIYRNLELPLIPPELREGTGEIARAQAGALPRLVTDSDIRGVLHAHTDLSDGVDTLEAMAEATRAHGYEYFGVADHSRSAHYAGGLSIDEIAAQHAEIDRLNRKQSGGFRILKGIESDILADGSLDYPDEVLASFDFVVASVHSRFRLDREAQTERIVRAVMNPRTTILGHMTGRQLLRRPGYDVDIPRVLAACARYGVAVEINANPRRLDLDWRWHQTALELGCMMSINPDAHSTREIDLMHWGVEMAPQGRCAERTGA
jgi:DNA polymerase (family X)